MKKILLTLLVVAFNACNNDDVPADPVSKLPPATQTGENTIGCLVNGEALLPKGSPLAGPVKNAFYQLIDGEYFFGLSFSNKNGEVLKSLRIGTLFSKLSKNQTIVLDKNFGDDGDYIGGGGEYGASTSVLEGTIGYVTTSTVNGELAITHLDETKQIISGTFWFDAINNDGDIVEIREGRFDMPYSK